MEGGNNSKIDYRVRILKRNKKEYIAIEGVRDNIRFAVIYRFSYFIN